MNREILQGMVFSLMVATALPSTAQADFTVKTVTIDDRKAVFASVASIDITNARARIAGTLNALSVDEGSAVQAGQKIAVVIDKKLPLQLTALDAHLESLVAQRQLAELDFKRTSELRRKGTVSQARLDEAQTNLNVVKSNIAAKRAERAVVAQQLKEGEVLAPASGRVLKVPVVTGAVVSPGETIAEIAADQYVLRLSVPERHARYIKAGDKVLVGQRGVGMTPKGLRTGTVRQVYPEIVSGRVSADVVVDALGDYFVGERTRVWVSAGTRRSFVVPPDYLFKRYGISFVRLKGGAEVVVQPGLPVEGGIEILSGLHDGDVLVSP